MTPPKVHHSDQILWFPGSKLGHGSSLVPKSVTKSLTFIFCIHAGDGVSCSARALVQPKEFGGIRTLSRMPLPAVASVWQLSLTWPHTTQQYTKLALRRSFATLPSQETNIFILDNSFNDAVYCRLQPKTCTDC